MPSSVIVAGLGCRRNCPATDIIAAIRAAEHAASCTVTALAAPLFKRAEPGLLDAAAILALPLRFIDDAALARAQPRCPTRSATTERITGHPSIAEAAALACAPTLLLPRQTHGSATCAIAALLPLAGQGRGGVGQGSANHFGPWNTGAGEGLGHTHRPGPPAT